eukprot:275059-Prymnesium_polylepis.1
MSQRGDGGIKLMPMTTSSANGSGGAQMTRHGATVDPPTRRPSPVSCHRVSSASTAADVPKPARMPSTMKASLPCDRSGTANFEPSAWS